MSTQVYINAAGKFLPGEPVSNDEMEARLGFIGGRASGARRRILKQNGIQYRYYAIDENQESRYSNAEMAALAARDAFTYSSLGADKLELLCAATSQGDLPLPGFASMVHGELGGPVCEVATTHGVCASGMMALKYAYAQIKAGEKSNALVCASEFPSRLFKASRFENQRTYRESRKVNFDAEFLRWMLSDGAGAFLMGDRPEPGRLSLRLDWIELRSYAGQNDACMYIGANKERSGEIKRSWLDYPDYQAAVDDGAMNLKQDIRMLDGVLKSGVDLYFELMEKRGFRAEDIDWLVCHYSSHVFKDQIAEMLKRGGGYIPEERWFTNLYTRGNTGSASIFLMLEELLNSGKLQAGQKILCMVPESGRFIASYMMLTVVKGESGRIGEPGAQVHMVAGEVAADVNTVEHPQGATPPPAAPELHVAGDEHTKQLVRDLTRVWIDFEGKLNQVPIIDRINRDRLRLEDYLALLYNMRQQVVEGSRWIGRAASSLDMNAFELRSIFQKHVVEEHRDFRMLEQNFASCGGDPGKIRSGEKNIGSEALSAWMFQRASRENPLDLLGAMFIIEGLGTRMGGGWARKIRDQLNLTDDQVSFLLYHGEHDEDHLEQLETALGSNLITPEVAAAIVKTAKVTARLYLLQLEEIDNF